jgi:hypothetical protein
MFEFAQPTKAAIYRRHCRARQTGFCAAIARVGSPFIGSGETFLILNASEQLGRRTADVFSLAKSNNYTELKYVFLNGRHQRRNRHAIACRSFGPEQQSHMQPQCPQPCMNTERSSLLRILLIA